MTSTSESHNALVARRWQIAAGVAALLVALGGFALWRFIVADADVGDAPTPARMRAFQAQVDTLEQRIVTLSRSDQISRDANRDLQGALAERDEEIAGLRADVAFYERLVGATAQRRGLNVHELKMQPQAGQAWHFTATLTQNLNRGAVNAGDLRLLVEGTQGGRLKRLDWAALRQQPQADGMPYSFKYFQQVEGDLMLPEGFEPVRVIVQLKPANGALVEQSFPWRVATAREGAGGA